MDFQASSYIELPEKYKNSQSFINFKKIMINFVFYGVSCRICSQLKIIKIKHQNMLFICLLCVWRV